MKTVNIFQTSQDPERVCMNQYVVEYELNPNPNPNIPFTDFFTLGFFHGYSPLLEFLGDVYKYTRRRRLVQPVPPVFYNCCFVHQ